MSKRLKAEAETMMMIPVLSQIMVPKDYQKFITILTGHVNDGVIKMSRINDAVTRILRIKFTMGLFENPYSDASMAEQLGKQVLIEQTLMLISETVMLHART